MCAQAIGTMVPEAQNDDEPKCSFVYHVSVRIVTSVAIQAQQCKVFIDLGGPAGAP